jgi:hypothetical protein
MPSKKTSSNISILMDENEFLKAKQASNTPELEDCLTVLMELANNRYNAVYRRYRNNPDIEKFSYCGKNFKSIKSIIEHKENPTQLTNKLYLEAWISMLYSDVHALNLEPKAKDQLNELNEKIQAIETDFKQLLTKTSSLDSNDKISARLLKYIEDFEQTWKTKDKRILADSHYNFAETLVEKANGELDTTKRTFLEDAKRYFIQSADFYKQANLLKFETQTEQRIQKLEKALKTIQDSSNNNHFGLLPDKKMVVVLTKLSPSFENKGIKTESLWTACYRETSGKLTEIVDQSILPLVTQKIAESDEIKPIQGKRKLFDHDIKPAKKVRYETACTKLSNEFKQIGIEKYNFSDPSHENELIRYKASLASKFASAIIENLNFPNKKLSDTEKLGRLKEAQSGFSKSIAFYSQAGLPKEKGKIIQCSNLLASTIEKLNPSVDTKTPIKISNSSTNRKPGFDKQIVSNTHLNLPIRYTRTFFKSLSHPENNTPKVDTPDNFDNKVLASP